jgi:anaerobic magnesium-protoporphyrin IX monomethyl ester cyclase
MAVDLLLTVPIPTLVTRDPVLIPDHGLGYLAASVRRAGHGVRVIDWNPKLSVESYRRQLVALAPRVVGVKAFTVNMAAVLETMKVVREALPEALIIVGGPHPTVAEPRHLWDEMPLIDLAFRGEAESALPRLVELLKTVDFARARLPELHAGFGEIDGLVWREAGEVKANATIYEDIHAVGMPAWDLIDPSHSAHFPIDAEAARKNPHPAPILTTRGCPFECTFCCAHHVNSRRARRREVTDVLAELEHLRTHVGTTQVVITDSSFMLNRGWVRQLCEGMIERGLDGLRWECHYEVQGKQDPEGMDELFGLMARAGCRKIAFSPEVCSPRMIERVHKNYDPEPLREIHALARAHGMSTMGFFMVGFPGETLEEVDITLEYALSEPYDQRFFTPLIPLPGTEVYAWLKQREGFERIDWATYRFERPPYNLSEVPPSVLRQRLIRANLRAHLREARGPRKLLSRRPWELAAKYAVRRALRW